MGVTGYDPKRAARKAYVRALSYDLADTRARAVELGFEITHMLEAGDDPDWREDSFEGLRAREQWLVAELEHNGVNDPGRAVRATPASAPPPATRTSHP